MCKQLQILSSIFLSLCLAWAAIGKALADEFPYQAVVERENAPLRCGPGGQYYATANLTAGTKVEVYGHAADGWCAIRPLEDCFSLIPSTQTRLADDASLAEVTAERAVSWIGSSVEAQMQLFWQVRLEPGEAVEIVGLVRRASLAGEGKEVWYKIRPPAGEFRYIHRDDLTVLDMPSALEASQVKVASHKEPAPTVPAADDSDDTQAQWRVRTSPRARQADASSGEVEQIAIIDPAVATVTGAQDNPSPTPPAAAQKISADADVLLNELDVELSLLAARPVAEWDFALFDQKLAALEQMQTSTKQRTRMVQFRRRMQPFVELFQKQARLAAELPTTAKPSAPAASDAPAEPIVASEDNGPIGTGLAAAADQQTGEAEVSAQEDIPAEYDGVGILMPVISREQQAPPFALLDKNGKVLGFVSPVPGLNLRRYVKQEVGVIGQRGYLPKYQASHLTAQRIIVLDRHR